MASFSDMKKALERAKSSAANMKKKAEKTLGTVVHTGETTGTAFLLAYLRGRLGDNENRIQVQGVDLDLAGGLLMHGIGILVGDAYSGHAAAIGDGGLACYGTFKGFELGFASRGKKTGAKGRPAELSGQGVSGMHSAQVTDSVFDRVSR